MAGTWASEEVALLREAFGRGQVPPSPRGLTEAGLGDYRGFPLERMGRGAVLTQADFTKARAPKNAFGVEQSIQLDSVQADGCLFDGAGKFLRLSGRFTGCSFRKITTRSAAVQGRFEDCDFTGASFKGAHLEGEFLRCRFDAANLHVASWTGAFRECRFAGAGIHDVFADIRSVAVASESVSFTATTNRVILG
jgi:hypothetical protein